jgi:isoamylase
MNLFNYKGEPVTDGTFLLFFNAHHKDFEICLPGHANVRWRPLLDTQEECGWLNDGPVRDGGATLTMLARSFVLFEQQGGTGEEARDVRGRRTAGVTPPTQPQPKGSTKASSS